MNTLFVCLFIFIASISGGVNGDGTTILIRSMCLFQNSKYLFIYFYPYLNIPFEHLQMSTLLSKRIEFYGLNFSLFYHEIQCKFSPTE